MKLKGKMPHSQVLPDKPYPEPKELMEPRGTIPHSKVLPDNPYPEPGVI
jgi:hypothetical protein